MILLDGNATAKAIQTEIAAQVKQYTDQGQRAPHLVAVLVGEDGASQAYVGNKVRSCEAVGFRSTLLHHPATLSEADLLRLIESLNQNPEVDGFIVQLPLPKHISEEKVTLTIAPEKDVDGFHPDNIGRMVLGKDRFLPATPAGILELLRRYAIPTSGQHAIVLGRSHIVGRPMSILLSRKGIDATVTLAHSRTHNLSSLLPKADIIVAALGIPEFVRGSMVKEGAVVIDVGITRVADPSKKRGYVLKGDVDFEAAAEKASYITPVPGGVGPMTVAALLQNTLRAYQKTYQDFNN
ncbi:MAG: bifunctional 5,10-methylenetetrahydrofolate dehydrogenase/5,10-methenyltetrahydrofolate cyclohydrolase [Bernardetiaceae bacterium]